MIFDCKLTFRLCLLSMQCDTKDDLKLFAFIHSRLRTVSLYLLFFVAFDEKATFLPFSGVW